MTTFKKLFAALLFISVAISARADGEHQHPEINIYDYQIETVELDGQTYQRAVVTKDHDHSRHMTFEEVLAALASAGIKYVICPEGLTPEQFQAAKDKKTFYAVVVKEDICEAKEGWVYYYASEPDSAMIYTGTPKEVNGQTAKGVVTVSTKLNIESAEYKLKSAEYKLNGQPFTGKLFHDVDGNLFGVENFDVNKQVNLAYKEAFTYVDGTGKRVKYNYGVVSKEDGFWGVLNPKCVIKLDYVDKLLKYTHTVDGETYAYLEEVYGMAYSKDSEKNHVQPDGKNVYGMIGGKEVELTHNDSPTFVDLYKKGDYFAIYNKEKDGDIYVFKGYLHEMEECGHDTQHYTYCTNLEGHVHTDSLWKGEVIIDKGKNGKDVKLDFGWQYVTADENKDGIYADLYDGYVCVDHDRYSDTTSVSHHAHGYDADKSVFKEIEATITYSYYNRFTGKRETFTGHTESHYHEYLPIDFTVDLKKIPNAPVPTGKFHLYADVKTPIDKTTNKLTAPGQLRKALHSWEELGNPNNRWYFNVPNVTRLTLSGVVCFADIADQEYMSANGHAKIYDGNVERMSDGKMDIKEVTDSKGNKYRVDDPSGEAVWQYQYVQAGIKGMTGAKLEYLDLSDAVFPVQTDLNISLSQPGVKKVLLPTSEQMWLIPDGAFNNCHYIEELCIPHNYTKIGSRAFCNTHALRHIYTTSDPNNPDDEFVDNGPNTFTFASTLKEIEGGVIGGAEATFFGSQMDNVTDIYVLATVAPKCGANAFSAAMTYGNNGFAGNWKHPIRRENYNNNDKWICVLHYPTNCEESQAKNYTDITRKYTLNDEVGDVDGTGKPMVWPRHAEFFRAYNQAVNGVTWGAWQEYPTKGWTQEVIRTLEEAKDYNIDNTKNYDQAYQGWHEFVLTGNSNSIEIDVQKETVFVQRDWYTLCVPYDLKKSQMLELFGIDLTKSANNKVKMLGATGYTDVTETMYPDVRVLTEVSRSVKQEKMTLHLSKPLLNDSEGKDWAVVIPESGQGYSYEELTGDDPVIIKGGHPFLVRGFIPEIWSEKIKSMGMYIMAVAASDNKVAALEGKTEKELPYQFNAECFDHNIPLPCVKHHIHARNADQDPNVAGDEYVYIDTEKKLPACYHFIGTYSTTTIPQYAYYLGKSKSTGKHTFFRSTKDNTSWNPYSAVIIGLNDPFYDPEDIKKEGSIALQNILVEWNNPQSDLVVLPGETNNPANAGKPFSFVMDEEGKGEPTGIVDVNLKENVKVNNNKVYGINGQYIGTSLKNLPKGIYIINGQKFVVK